MSHFFLCARASVEETLVSKNYMNKILGGREEGIREQYSHAFNPMITEGFFADKVVIVEGSEQ